MVAVRKSRESRLGEDHLQTLDCLDHLAAIYWEMGRWKEAEDADS